MGQYLVEFLLDAQAGQAHFALPRHREASFERHGPDKKSAYRRLPPPAIYDDFLIGVPIIEEWSL